MRPRSLIRPSLVPGLLLALAATTSARGQASEEWRAMNRPVEPFRIMGNLYYVGASDVTSFLITTPEGHILLDGGFAETVPLIRASVERLGFDFADIRILLNSHAHFDHAGGLARIKALTGARLVASRREAPLLERGGRGDDLLGDAGGYEPVTVDRQLADGDFVELGGTRLQAHVTAGHTRGCTSWSMEVREADSSHLAVFICSLSILRGMRLTGEPTYPGIARDFERSITTLRALPAELFLAAHASFFRMADKRTRLESGESPNPFLDAQGYRAFLDRAAERLERQLAQERSGR